MSSPTLLASGTAPAGWSSLYSSGSALNADALVLVINDDSPVDIENTVAGEVSICCPASAMGITPPSGSSGTIQLSYGNIWSGGTFFNLKPYGSTLPGLDYVAKFVLSGTPWSLYGINYEAFTPMSPTITLGPYTPSVETNNYAAHGLGRVPYFTRAIIVCTTAELGYSVGDIVDVTEPYTYDGPCNVWSNATYLGYQTGYYGISIVGKGSNYNGANITPAHWQLYVVAW
jgi:hypothetical protein